MKITMFIFIFFPFCCFGQKINQMDSKQKKQGRWEKYYDDKQTAKRYTGQFKDDKPIGEFVYYFEEPKNIIDTKLIWENDSICKAEYYFTNGVLSASGILKNKKKEGLWTFYDNNGKILSKQNFISGELNGDYQTFFENGTLGSQVNYIDNLPDGKAVYFYPSGEKQFEGFFKNGQRIGIWSLYEKNVLIDKINYDTIPGNSEN